MTYSSASWQEWACVRVCAYNCTWTLFRWVDKSFLDIIKLANIMLLPALIADLHRICAFFVLRRLFPQLTDNDGVVFFTILQFFLLSSMEAPLLAALLSALNVLSNGNLNNTRRPTSCNHKASGVSSQYAPHTHTRLNTKHILVLLYVIGALCYYKKYALLTTYVIISFSLFILFLTFPHLSLAFCLENPC